MTRFSHPAWRMLAGIVASTVLLGVYARGGNAYVLGFVALAPWLLALNGVRGFGASVGSGLGMSLGFVAAVFAWFGFAIAKFTGLGEISGLLILLTTSPLLQPQFLVFAVVRSIAGRRHGATIRALAGASAWVATESLYAKLLGDTLGHGLYPSHVLRQFADIGGAAGITFLLILVNECVATAIARRREGAGALARPLAIGAIVVALMAGYGLMRWSALTSTTDDADPPLRIGMVQSNIVDYERLRREMGAYEVVRLVLDTHYAMSREAVEQHRVDALLWSETVFPTTFDHPKSEDGAALDREIFDFVNAAGVPLVFGTYDIDEHGEYNAAAFVEPSRGTLGFYRKARPFLLSEYVPAWMDGPTFRRWLPWTGTWKRGTEARVFPLRLADGREIPVSPMICLDDVDTGLAIDGARLGAQAIVGMSNDSWFTEHPQGVDLHLAVAAFRSIETRLPQVRVTNNGVSAVIDATGTVVSAAAMGERKLLIGEVRPRQPAPTLMVAWGDWVGRAAIALLLALAALSSLRAFARRHARDTAARAASTQASAQTYRAEVAVLSPPWRIAAASLQTLAIGSLLWMGIAAWLGDDSQTQPLSQLRMFAALFLAPMAAAWAILRASRATAQIENGVLRLDQRERRIEIDARDIVALHPWRLPLPGTGAGLTLASGRRWSHAIALSDPGALAAVLAEAGAQPALAQASGARASLYARARHAVTSRMIDRPILKFVLFPLVPALPAFRLHQHIAYGGTFGEYYTYGLKAYLLALLIWWASWAVHLVMFAGGLRAVVEAGTLAVLALRPERTTTARKILFVLARLIYYVGMPAWLLFRFLGNL
ncbi:MAG: apolipoprotein N-acyltransferase [Lysobacteraceae bacterium]|nr:MAG: apolipoprotein N-acyltransferase [Xanthomonadaceae bacterium]